MMAKRFKVMPEVKAMLGTKSYRKVPVGKYYRLLVGPFDKKFDRYTPIRWEGNYIVLGMRKRDKA